MMPWWMISRKLRPTPARAARLAMTLVAALVPMATLSCRSHEPQLAAEYIGPMTAAAEARSPVATMPASAPAATTTAPAPVVSDPASSASAPTTTQPASAPAAAGTPLRLTVQQAIVASLRNNEALAVERLGPDIQQTFEDDQRAAFDPVAAWEASMSRAVSQRLGRAGSGTEGQIADSFSSVASVGVFLPTGTHVDLLASTTLLDSSLYSDTFQSTRAGLTVTQALLRGAGVRVNLVQLQQARLDTLVSQYELRGFAESLVADVESAYWDYALAQRQIDIYTDSLHLAEQQLQETRERIAVGTLGETELAAAQAEVALRRESLIAARSDLAEQRLRLGRLLNVPTEDPWDRQIVLVHPPAVLDVALDDVASHVRVALRMRPDLNQAHLQVQRDDLQVVRTRNGLLPQLDLFINLGKTGYANSFVPSVRDMPGDGHDVLVGLRGEYPFGNRAARADHRRAVLQRQQADQAVRNMAQIVVLDVRSAFIRVQRFHEAIAATRITRQFQAEKLRAEAEKLRVGKSTALLVAGAQRDLLASQIAEVQTVVSYLKALVDLYRLEGSLLERRGIAAPGREPVAIR